MKPLLKLALVALPGGSVLLLAWALRAWHQRRRRRTARVSEAWLHARRQEEDVEVRLV